MYKAFYRLKDNPFRLTPDPAFIYLSVQHREALSGLVHSVCTRAGLTVLVGEVGTGKTTLLCTLVGLLEKRGFLPALLTNSTLTREEFYDTLLLKLQVECSSALKSRQLMALERKLLQRQAEGRRTVLIVDEAQRLALDVLEEIRLLLNIETPHQKLLNIIVAGQPELGDTLALPEMRQLKQRISCVCRLQPLSLDEVREYIYHRLTQAALPEQDLFPDGTIKLIYEYSQGIPRLVNSICEAALQTGFALVSPRITPPIIHEVATDLDLASGYGLNDRKWLTENPANGDIKPPIGANGPADKVPYTDEEIKRITDEARAEIEVALKRVDVAGRGTSPAEDPSPAPETSEPVVVRTTPFVPYTNGNDRIRVPLEAYTARQKSLGLFANLIDRWR